MNIRRIIAIGFVFLSIQAVWTVYNTYIPNLLSTRFGMSAGFIATFLMIDRLITIILEPAMGRLSDRLKKRIGTALPLALVGVPLTGLVFAIIPLPVRFLPTGGQSEIIQTITNPFLVFSIVCLFVMSFIRVPAVRIMPDITAPAFRDRANGILQSMASSGSLLAAYVSAYLVTIDIGAPFWAAVVVLILAGIALYAIRLGIASEVPSEGLPASEEEKKDEVKTEDADKPTDRSTEDKPDGRPEPGLGLGAAASDDGFGKLVTFFMGQAGTPARGGAAQAAARPEEQRMVAKSTLPSLIPLLVGILLCFMALGMFNAFFPVYAESGLNLAKDDVTRLNTTFALTWTVLVVVAWNVSAKLGRRRTVLIGLAGMALGLALTRVGGGPLVTGLCLVVAAAGWSLILGHILPMVLTLAPSQSTGLYTGFYFVAFVGAGAVNQVVMPQITAMTGQDPGLRFLSISLVLVLAAACMLRVRHSEGVQTQAPAPAPAK